MEHPRLSVIVCTYNRKQYIAECLTHLANQSIDHKSYEVLVIDNNSSDHSREKIQEIIAAYPKARFKYHLEEKQGLTYARNRGIFESKGSIVSFVDDDAFVKYSYCENVISFFDRNKSVAAIGGKIIPKYEEDKPDWMSRYLLPLVAAIDLGDTNAEFKGSSFPIGANMAFRKQVFETYGLFDVNLGRRGEVLEAGEEKDMFLRLKKAKEKIIYCPDVTVEHIIPPFRVETKYIRALALGVGASERRRIKKGGLSEILRKAVSELIKAIGTIVISTGFLLTNRVTKASMLIKFRYWVISALVMKKK